MQIIYERDLQIYCEEMYRHQKVADDHLRYFKDDWISLQAIRRFPNTDKKSVPQEKILKEAPARPNISKNLDCILYGDLEGIDPAFLW